MNGWRWKADGFSLMDSVSSSVWQMDGEVLLVNAWHERNWIFWARSTITSPSLSPHDTRLCPCTPISGNIKKQSLCPAPGKYIQLELSYSFLKQKRLRESQHKLGLVSASSEGQKVLRHIARLRPHHSTEFFGSQWPSHQGRERVFEEKSFSLVVLAD